MNTYKFEITETLQRIVNIEAESENEAHEIINSMYIKEEIVLDSHDFIERVIDLVD